MTASKHGQRALISPTLVLICILVRDKDKLSTDRGWISGIDVLCYRFWLC